MSHLLAWCGENLLVWGSLHTGRFCVLPFDSIRKALSAGRLSLGNWASASVSHSEAKFYSSSPRFGGAIAILRTFCFPVALTFRSPSKANKFHPPSHRVSRIFFQCRDCGVFSFFQTREMVQSLSFFQSLRDLLDLPLPFPQLKRIRLD